MNSMKGKDRGEAFWRQNPNLHTSLHKSPAINQTHPIRNNVGMMMCLLSVSMGAGEEGRMRVTYTGGLSNSSQL